eukprot:gene19067-38259_t
MVEALADRFHAVAFDYRGHGDTPRPDGPVVWDRYGDDAVAMGEAMVAASGGPVPAFGHSMGGACLLMAAHRHPGLFSRLVVFEPIVFPPAGIRPPGDESPLAAGARRRRATFPSYEAAIENFSAKPPLRGFTPAALDAYVRFGFREDADGVHLKCRPETEAETFEGGGGHDTWNVLAEIETPVLVIAGKVEPMQPSNIAAGVAELLPSANTIIFDEAHQLPDTATLFFGQTVSTAQILELCRDVLAEGLAHARGGPDWAKVVTVVEKSARDLRLTFPQDIMRLSLAQIMPSSDFFPALENMKQKLAEMVDVLEDQAARAETLEQCRVRAVELAAALDGWKASGKGKLVEGDEAVLWVEAFSSSLHLHKTPLSI